MHLVKIKLQIVQFNHILLIFVIIWFLELILVFQEFSVELILNLVKSVQLIQNGRGLLVVDLYPNLRLLWLNTVVHAVHFETFSFELRFEVLIACLLRKRTVTFVIFSVSTIWVDVLFLVTN